MIDGLVEFDLACHVAASAAAIGLALPLRAGPLRRARLDTADDGEIQSLLWSLTAVAVALVVATRELIQCGTGAPFRAVGRSLKVGDRIEIDGICGEIVEHRLLTTTIAERERRSAGDHPSGRLVVMPNGRLFSADVRIERRDGTAVLHRVHMTFEPSVSAQAAVTVAVRIVRRFAPQGEAHVGLATTEMAKIRIDIALVCRPERAADVERAVKMEFLEWLWAQAQSRQAKAHAERYAAGNDAGQRAA